MTLTESQMKRVAEIARELCWAEGYEDGVKCILAALSDPTLNGREWISVEDRLPEDGQLIVGISTHTDFIWNEYWDSVEPSGKMTHWMPLPAAPAKEE